MTSTIMVLLPGDDYITLAEHPHLTVAYFQTIPDDVSVEPLKRDLEQLASLTRPIPVFTDARTVFTDRADRSTLLVDLVNGYRLVDLRSRIERLYGPQSWRRVDASPFRLDAKYGFIPHMTVCPTEQVDIEDALLNQFPQSFMLSRLGLWHGEERYEVDL